MKTKEDILFECWHESNDTSPTNETILKAMDRFAKEYHTEQLRIVVVGVQSEQFFCQHKLVLDCKEQCHKCKQQPNSV